MALTQVTGPYPIFTDLDGTPLDDGYLYIGAVNEDPEQNPIQVFWDANLTIQASQPIRTNNGYAYRNGTPALIYTAGPFSITIRNKREEFVLYSPVGYGFDPAAVSASVTKNDFIGDGVEVDFVLSAAPSTILATNVFINGVYQEKDSYSIFGNVLTFGIAPPLNSSIEVMTNETGVINSGNATAISYTAGFAGATAQTVQTKLEQYVSAKDFGAVGDGVANDTASIQAAIDAAIAQNQALYIPGGVYNITSLSLVLGTVTDNGFKIYGDGGASTYGTRGTILKCIGSSGNAFEISGTSASYFCMNDITFTGNANMDAGVVFNNAWFAKFLDCSFVGFSKATAKALWFYANSPTNASGYSGTTYITRCNFGSNAVGVASSGDTSDTTTLVNFLYYDSCIFLDHTVAAIKIGTIPSPLMQARSHHVSQCDFEGNKQDILMHAAAYSFSVQNSYFENNTETTFSRIEWAYDGVNPGPSAVDISNNFFQQGALTTGNSVITLAGENIIVRNNFLTNGNQTDRYFLTATSATKVEAEPGSAPPGITPLPIRISAGSLINAKTYNSLVNTGFRLEPLVSGAANPAIIYQGSGSPSNSLGAAGDLYVNSASTGANADGREALWQKGTSFWKRISYLQSISAEPYSATINPNLALGAIIEITPNNGSAFAIEAPTNAVSSQVQIYSIVIINTTGGALGALTWRSAIGGYKLAAAWTQPANGFRRIITFYYDAISGYSYEMSRSAGDVPNP
jgi:hypothetical protein